MTHNDESGVMAGYCFFACLVIAVLAALSGCTNKVADISVAPPPAQTCLIPKLPPVPKDVVLDISGDKITSNRGGELLLRGYVACRSAAARAK